MIVLIKKNDTELAVAIRHAFKSHWDIPEENIKIDVKKGWVTLTGEIKWNYHKQAAQLVVSNFLGVKEITNNITIIPKAKKAVINVKELESALWRNVTIDHNSITITVTDGNKITLTGTVDSLRQIDEASRIVWSAPGVLELDNQLTVNTDTLYSK